VFGCLSGAIAVLSILFVAETKFVRTLEALSRFRLSYRALEDVLILRVDGEGIDEDGTLVPVTTQTPRELDTVNYPPRSFIKDMLPWKGHSNWSEAIDCWKHMVQIIWFPNILWLIFM
jgi:hypothetical protein